MVERHASHPIATSPTSRSLPFTTLARRSSTANVTTAEALSGGPDKVHPIDFAIFWSFGSLCQPDYGPGKSLFNAGLDASAGLATEGPSLDVAG